MEPEFSLPCSQGTATGLFSVPNESSPHPRIFFHVGVHFFLSHLRQGFQAVFLILSFHTRTLSISVQYYVPHTQPISFSLI